MLNTWSLKEWVILNWNCLKHPKPCVFLWVVCGGGGKERERKIYWSRHHEMVGDKWMVFPCGSDGKERASSAGDLGLIPRSGRSLKKGIAIHFSILAWRIWRIVEPGGLQSIGSQRGGHDWATNTFITLYRSKRYHQLEPLDVLDRWHVSMPAFRKWVGLSLKISST